jgi:hypothetical protein
MLGGSIVENEAEKPALQSRFSSDANSHRAGYFTEPATFVHT